MVYHYFGSLLYSLLFLLDHYLPTKIPKYGCGMVYI